MTADTLTIPKKKKKTKFEMGSPSLYKVIFYNDDFTPFDFVKLILTVIFGKNEIEAFALTQEIHINKKAIIGLYPKEIAVTKQALTDINAKNNGYPLLCEIEPE